MKKRMLGLLLAVMVTMGQALPGMAAEGDFTSAEAGLEEAWAGEETLDEPEVIELIQPEEAQEDRFFETEDLFGDGEEESSDAAPVGAAWELPEVVPVAAGDTLAAASPIVFGGQVSGALTETNSIDYYKFTLPSSGRITIAVTCNFANVTYQLFDDAGSNLWNTSQEWNSVSQQISTNKSFDLTKGTYYFTVGKRRYYETTGSYNFRINFTSAGETFEETGNGIDNSLNESHAIALSQKYNGQLAVNDGTDFYQFVLPTSGTLRYTATAAMSNITYVIYDEDGVSVWSSNSEWNSTTQLAVMDTSMYLISGTYYLSVSKRRYYETTGTYFFQLDFTSAGESFAESKNSKNNDIYSANAISLGQTYKGQLAMNDDKDFYSFSIATDAKMNLTSTAGMRYVSYIVYGSDGSEQKVINPEWNSTTRLIDISQDFDLSAGSYYLAIVKRRYYEWDGNYSFILDKAHTHTYTSRVTPATQEADGKIEEVCSCGDVRSTVEIPSIGSITLTKTKYAYTGKAKKPGVVVRDRQGNVVGTENYKVKYATGRKSVGAYKVKVTFKNHYAGSKSLSFSIVPPKTKITKVASRSTGFYVKWKKQTTQASGLQLQYSVSSSFKPVTKLAKRATTTALTLRGLPRDTTYYIRVRTYKKVGKKTYYSSWSNTVAVTTR